jgi:hypothetical protein
VSEQITITIHEVAHDGLPEMDALTGRVAFIFDGCVVSGWPLDPNSESYPYDLDEDGQLWEANDDVGHERPMGGVTHWIEFPAPVWSLTRT